MSFFPESIIKVAINNNTYSCVEEECIDNKAIMTALKRLEEQMHKIKHNLSAITNKHSS